MSCKTHQHSLHLMISLLSHSISVQNKSLHLLWNFVSWPMHLSVSWAAPVKSEKSSHSLQAPEVSLVCKKGLGKIFIMNSQGCSSVFSCLWVKENIFMFHEYECTQYAYREIGDLWIPTFCCCSLPLTAFSTDRKSTLTCRHYKALLRTGKRVTHSHSSEATGLRLV